jgi:SAM-dependent methyltransferase
MTDSRQFHPSEDYAARVAKRQAALQEAYDADWQIETDAQRKAAEALLALIGTDDWQGEGYASPDMQRDLSIRFHWGHTHRFAHDLAVEGRMKDRHVNLAAQFIEGFGLSPDAVRGKAVLDIGCWTGGTSLMLRTLGASSVHALEEVVKYAQTADRLMKEVYGLQDMQAEAASLYDLREGDFDLVYIPGVVYHLSDPVLGLRRLFNCLKDGGEILVESAGIDDDRAICLFRGNRRQVGGSAEGLNRSGWAWFWPSASCLACWLDEAGFEDVSVFRSPVDGRVYGKGTRKGYREITRAGLSVRDIA